jgi:tRNA G18 (ribose-2'-O)-methylase SpoU
MNEFVHQRHQPPTTLERPRELIVVCPPLRSNVNLSRIIRLAGCCGIPRVICCGTAKVIGRIARDGADAVELETHRTLPPVLDKLRDDGYHLVGLEQTTESTSLHEFKFPRRTALILGNERHGIAEDVLAKLDDVVEIPIWGLPFSYNVATSAVMAVYEYCRQYPAG